MFKSFALSLWSETRRSSLSCIAEITRESTCSPDLEALYIDSMRSEIVCACCVFNESTYKISIWEWNMHLSYTVQCCKYCQTGFAYSLGRVEVVAMAMRLRM